MAINAGFRKSTKQTTVFGLLIFIVSIDVGVVAADSRPTRHMLKPIAAQNGSQLDMDDIDLSKAGSCKFFVFEMDNFERPWTEINMSVFDGRYSTRANGLLRIHSVSFNDAGLLRLGCQTGDFLQFLIVFDVARCQSNVSDDHVENGTKIQTTCEFRYSTGSNLLTNHWTAPIQWTSSGRFESCDDGMAKQEASGSYRFSYRACVIQTAIPPEVPPVNCALSYRDFRKVFKDSHSSHEKDSPTIWTSTAKLVRHGITRVLVEQAKVLVPAGNHDFVQTYFCEADGFPKPSFRWLNVERNTYVDGSALNITVYRGHRLMMFTSVERYVCVASNSFNELKSAEVSITVPSDWPAYIYVIVGVVLLVIVVSVTANVIIGCRSTAKRRQLLAIGEGQQTSLTVCSSTVNGRGSNPRYSGIDKWRNVLADEVSANSLVGAGGGREQQMSTATFGHYTALDDKMDFIQPGLFPAHEMSSEAGATDVIVDRVYDTIVSPMD